MSILVVKDAANSKLRELESNTSGELKVTLADVSGLGKETTLTSLNSKVTAVDTGAVVVATCALPSGAATETTLSSLNSKVTTVDTGAVVVSGSALPTGAATEASVSSAAGSLTTLAGAVTAGVVQVSSGQVSSSASQVFTNQAIGAGLTVKSSSKDVDAFKSVCVFGSTDNTNDPLEIEVSNDNSTWFELNNHFISVDYSSGHFGLNVDISARYIRLSKKNNGAGGEIISAIISAK